MRHLILTLLLWTTIGCTYNHVKSTDDNGDMENVGDLTQPDFKAVQAAVIEHKCATCHSNAQGNKGGVNLEDYPHVRAALSRIYYRALEKKDMPPAGGLGPQAAQLLQNWLDNGAPETVVVKGEKADPTLTRGPADWAKVRDKIFAKKCSDCHGAVSPSAGLDLTDIKQVRDKILLIVDRVKVRQDMPVAPYPAMTNREQTVLSQWIDSGMPQ